MDYERNEIVKNESQIKSVTQTVKWVQCVNEHLFDLSLKQRLKVVYCFAKFGNSSMTYTSLAQKLRSTAKKAPSEFWPVEGKSSVN